MGIIIIADVATTSEGSFQGQLENGIALTTKVGVIPDCSIFS